MLERVDSAALTPSFDVVGGRNKPRLTLKPQSLRAFMLMEAAMIVAHAARLATCEHCKTVFVVGPLTGRKSHARFCSDRHRLAALRARKKASA